mmetsp:Transcript_9346/g.28602  ORF Transcript_9346/g.28602 Transcript_9346/m.28602 type:complete len:356 (-) Transcript_9346:382-1449(-)|eukprot:CAMPEP_0198661028 /NCGR_PEP_ID=MMETSP1467-20131203/39623_1 /TAXON_ID=1462469 /ORGANISM="unid. sp., Strain CCMP2135" /LENGTH=355 /DNA_ID=CAMNT_0044397445 /DNA_START=109 /DNA_END=1176 /DNA_ORIENTATION=+
MGICGSSLSPEEKRTIAHSRNIEDLNARDHAKDGMSVKLLLLGAGESGKSTIFKQMKLLYGQGFSDDERRDWIPKIQMNAITAIKEICSAAVRLHIDGKISSRLSLSYVMNADERTVLTTQLADHIHNLWIDPGVQDAWDQRSDYQVIESSEVYLQKIEQIAASNYLPSDEDILASRVRTCGIVEESYIIENVEFVIIDVGGQRNERKKWIHCFDNVNAVIFVAALSEYNQMMFEDESQNRMIDTLHLFDSICNSRWFQKTAMILFLNKRDLFARKIMKSNIADVPEWGDYQGRNHSYDDGLSYFLQKFLEKNQHKTKDIYTHITCATDTENVRVVFDASKDIILKFNLEASGFM